MEILAILLFCIGLAICVAAGISVIWALAAGTAVFYIYARKQSFSNRAVLRMLGTGIRKSANVMIIMVMIGVMTAFWRCCGTLPVLIYYAVGFVRPQIAVLGFFLLNSLISFLIGTSFGTSATMGVVCMAMANTMGIDPVLAGGAILSGVFFGDRCSYVSSSALLVCSVTSTDIHQTMGPMLRTTAVPYALCCLIYGIAGLLTGGNDAGTSVVSTFQTVFRLHPLCLIPAIGILVLSVFRIETKLAILLSTLAAAILALTIQQVSLSELFTTALFGFSAQEGSAAGILNGGGIVSMISTCVIVGISASYEGIFRDTKLLVPIRSQVDHISEKTNSFTGMIAASLVTSMLACNQTLAILLTNDLCEEQEPEGIRRAVDLENSVVVLSPLIPWSIAGRTPLAFMGAPLASLAASCYLYILPLWAAVRAIRKRKTEHRIPGGVAGSHEIQRR